MKTLKNDRWMNAISRFRDKLAEQMEDQPLDQAHGPFGNPDSPFEALLDERQKEARRELEDIKGRVNSLVFMILGAILLNLLIKLLS